MSKRQGEIQHNDIQGSEPKRRKISRVSAALVEEPHELKSTSTVVAIEPCGIIERIILKNVMCHEYLDFDGFTPNINLLQGANGSGKSTIVAAIIAGLGGSSRATDRAKNLQSLIQNGKNWASIEIHLKNDGCSPYKSDVFGGKVIVERKLLLSGSSSYKIKSVKGHIISAKKDDLNRILDWYNFQVDNPVIILSQERAKTFLSNTNPNSLFEFFMTATQLRQYIDTHKETQNNYRTSTELLKRKQESLPILAEEVEEWAKKVHAINSLEEKRNYLSYLRKAKLWAEVIEEEEAAEGTKIKLEKIAGNLNKLDEKLKDLKKEKEELSKKHSTLDAQVVEIAEKSRHMDKELQSAKAALGEAKRHYRELMSEKHHLEKDSLEKEEDINTLKKKLDSNSTETRNKWEAKVSQMNAAKKNWSKQIDDLQQSLMTEKNHMQNLNSGLQEAEDELNHKLQEEKAITRRLEQLKLELQSVRGATDNLTVFGQYMPRVINDIGHYNARGFFHHKPIGPIASHIKVKEHQWIHVVENVTRNVLSGFLVFSKQDQDCLNKIFSRTIGKNEQKPSISIVPFRNAIHDVRRYETVSDDYRSMWSIIETDNIHVANMLLDQLQIESLLLVPSADEANDLLAESSKVPRNCKKAMTLNGDIYFPDPNFRVYSGRGKRPAQFLQVSVEQKIRDLEMNISSTAAEVEESRKETLEKRAIWSKLTEERRNSHNKQKDYLQHLSQLKGELQKLKNEEVPPPPDVYQLQQELTQIEGAKREVEKKKEELDEKVEEAKKNVKEADQKRICVLEESEKIQNSSKEYQEETAKIRTQLMQKKKELVALENMRKNRQDSHTQLTEELSKKKGEIEVLVKKITDVDPQRIEPEKSKKELERELIAQENAIKEEEAHHGNLQDVATNWREKSEAYKKIKEQVTSQEEFLKKLKVSLKSRNRYMEATKKLLSTVLKAAFREKIKMRNLVGQMEIDFDAQTLQILLTKDTGNKAQKLQSIQMMSGGERSFATVSFILALWDWIHSPIRIMDEFDIFMDVVSRNQCVEMIIKAVQSNIQYIMVSPLEYKIRSNNLQIFRMPNPERENNDGSEEI